MTNKMAEISPEATKILANDYLNKVVDLSRDLEITLKGEAVNDRNKEDIIDKISNAISEYRYWSNLYV